jgi:hypothetical protein
MNFWEGKHFYRRKMKIWKILGGKYLVCIPGNIPRKCGATTLVLRAVNKNSNFFHFPRTFPRKCPHKRWREFEIQNFRLSSIYNTLSTTNFSFFHLSLFFSFFQLFFLFLQLFSFYIWHTLFYKFPQKRAGTRWHELPQKCPLNSGLNSHEFWLISHAFCPKKCTDFL